MKAQGNHETPRKVTNGHRGASWGIESRKQWEWSYLSR